MKTAPHVNAAGYLILENAAGYPLNRAEVSAMLSAIDAGHVDALRHYAQHGTLPPEAPVWPGLSVGRRTDGWQVWNGPCGAGTGLLIASVVRQTGDTRWHCSLHYGPSQLFSGDTPQAAVDAARAWLASIWGLST